MELPQPCAGIGLSAWKSQAEFRSVKVTASDGKELFASDFSKGLGGQRSELAGALRQTGDRNSQRMSHATVSVPLQSDVTGSAKVRKLAGEGILLPC